jgi:hypothetical protein
MNIVSKISIRTLLGGVIGIVGLMLLVLSGQSAWEALRREAEAKQIAGLSAASHQLLSMTFMGNIERGDNLYALLSDAPIKPDTRKTISERRSRVVAGFDAALAMLGRVEHLGLAEKVTQFQQAYQRIVPLRPVIDEAVQSPRESRDPGLVATWREVMLQYMTALKTLTTTIDDAIGVA